LRGGDLHVFKEKRIFSATSSSEKSIAVDAILINTAPRATGTNDPTLLPPLGLGYIAAMVEKNGFSCRIIDQNVTRFSNQALHEYIPADTKIIGIYLNSFVLESARELALAIKEQMPDTFIVLGGPLASARPKMVLKLITCDGVICGEGEHVFSTLLQNIAQGRSLFAGDVPGAVYLGSEGTIVHHSPRRIRDLNELPFPAYHLMPSLRRYRSRSRKVPAAPLITSRGCTFECTFCSKDIFGRKVTYRSVENVLAEVDHLVQRYGVKQLDIVDDNIALNRGRLVKILQGIIAREHDLVINMQVGIRAEGLDEEVLSLMKRSGVFKLAFGIESADEELLHLHKKSLDLKNMEATIRMAQKMGFIVQGLFIIGLFGETEVAFNRTLDFVKRLDLDVVNYSLAIPFVGTELHAMVEEQGRFLFDMSGTINEGFFGGRVFFTYGGFSEQDILERYRRAYRETYPLRKRLKMFLSVKSLNELLWLFRSGWSVFKSMYRTS
jgi:anaerobic magnesium-protoporphyrin IX monomethyl ester cyclase